MRFPVSLLLLFSSLILCLLFCLCWVLFCVVCFFPWRNSGCIVCLLFDLSLLCAIIGCCCFDHGATYDASSEVTMFFLFSFLNMIFVGCECVFVCFLLIVFVVRACVFLLPWRDFGCIVPSNNAFCVCFSWWNFRCIQPSKNVFVLLCVCVVWDVCLLKNWGRGCCFLVFAFLVCFSWRKFGCILPSNHVLFSFGLCFVLWGVCVLFSSV